MILSIFRESDAPLRWLPIWGVGFACLYLLVLFSNPGFLHAGEGSAHIAALRGAFGGAAGAEGSPGYGLFLLPFQALGIPFAAVPVVQAALVLFTGLLAGAATREAFPTARGAAATATLLVCFNPTPLIHALWVQPETLFSCLLMAGTLCFVRAANRGGLLVMALGTFLLTGAGAVLPVALYLPYVPAPVLALRFVWRRRWTALFGLVVVLALHGAAMSAWNRHVDRVGAGFVPPRAANIDIYEDLAAGTVALREGRALPEVRREFRTRLAQMPRSERDDFAERDALRILREYPLTALRVWAKGAVALMGQTSLTHVLTMTGIRSENGLLARYAALPLPDFVRLLADTDLPLLAVLVAGGLLLTAFWLFFWLGALRGATLNLRATAVLLAVIASLALVSCGPQTMDRFRHPFIPLAAVLAGVGLQRVLFMLRKPPATMAAAPDAELSMTDGFDNRSGG